MGEFKGEPFEREHRRAPRFELEPALRRAVEHFLVPKSGQVELEHLLTTEPQRGTEGHLRYLVTSGMAVELITGFEREHHDLDLVLMDDRSQAELDVFQTDNVTPHTYWAKMRFDPWFLEETAWMAKTIPTRMNVEVVHPGILIVQKLSNAFGRIPRKKDHDDVDALIEFWAKQNDPEKWKPIINHALGALPDEEAVKTFERLAKKLGIR